MRLLCTPPIAEHWSAELAELDATVTTLEFDGTVLGDAGANWDGAFISSEAFKLFYAGGRAALQQLYSALAELVRAGRVAWCHLCMSGLDVPFAFPLMKACHDAGATLTHCPGVYAAPIAQYCVGHMLSICRLNEQHRVNQAARRYERLLHNPNPNPNPNPNQVREPLAARPPPVHRRHRGRRRHWLGAGAAE